MNGRFCALMWLIAFALAIVVLVHAVPAPASAPAAASHPLHALPR